MEMEKEKVKVVERRSSLLFLYHVLYIIPYRFTLAHWFRMVVDVI